MEDLRYNAGSDSSAPLANRKSHAVVHRDRIIWSRAFGDGADVDDIYMAASVQKGSEGDPEGLAYEKIILASMEAILSTLR